MYIYTALFEQCATEDELTAVMSHEFAHVYCRHVQKGTQRQYAIMGAAAAAGVVGAAVAKDNRVQGATAGAGVGAAAAGFLGMGFTRHDEDEADKYGFYFHMMGGWDPNHFADFFKRMIDMGYDKTPELASDHPSLANRVENTKRRISELPKDYTKWKKPNTATAEQFAALKQRAKDVGAKMPDDASLQKAQQLLAAFPSCVSATDNQPEQVQARQQIQQNVNAQQKK
jgi:predicted Zn-dependent protease